MLICEHRASWQTMLTSAYKSRSYWVVLISPRSFIVNGVLKSFFFLMLLICSHELRKNIPHYKRTGGSESRTQVLASYCSSDVIDPGSHTHTSPEGSRGILGLSRHMTNCSVLLHEAHQRCKKSSARGCSDASAFCWSLDTSEPKTERHCCLLLTYRRLCHLWPDGWF